MKRATGVAIAVLAAGVAGSVRAAAEATERVSPVVLASSFGWNATNATKCLQSAFDSGAAKVVIDRQAGDWIIEPVFLRSNQEVVVADGVVVRALKGAYKHPNHCLFSAKGVTNVVLRGKGKALLRMERDAYTKRSEYSFSEWRHTLSIMDSADIRVSDLAFSHSGGDGIYVGRGSVDIDIRRVDCSDHYRQGISVISARNLTIADSRFTATKGTPPQCGIDFEPNFASEELVNCLVENCYFDGNASSGILLQLMVFKDTTKPVSITIRNCRARGNNSNGIVMMVSGTSKRKPVKGSIRIENCQFIGNKERAMSINGLTRETASVMVKDTIFDARGGEWGGILINNDGLLDDAANLTFENCRIVVDGKQPLEFSGTRGVGVESIDGTLVVERRGVSTPFDFAAFAAENRPDPEVRCAFGEAFSNWDDLRPVEPDAVVKKATPKCRGKFTFLQYLPNEGDYTISFRSFVVGPRKLDCPVRMRDITGVELGAFSITAAVQSVTIQTNARNLRRFEIDTCGNAVSIASPYPGQGILADAPLGLFK
ncbi:MAG: right-handed parallel beta-helix repeat-containing protein, partial [Kiritimatiellae bacterium]|nr:right-handed parallel beta-helix repeat-containing protein [Kiritimatiellia bacterium]